MPGLPATSEPRRARPAPSLDRGQDPGGVFRDAGRCSALYPEDGFGPWLTISALAAGAAPPLIVLGYLLLRQPVNLMIGVERPMLRRFVTVIGALVACRLFLSLPG